MEVWTVQLIVVDNRLVRVRTYCRGRGAIKSLNEASEGQRPNIIYKKRVSNNLQDVATRFLDFRFTGPSVTGTACSRCGECPIVGCR